MRFYYFSIFSWIVYAFAISIAIGLFSFLWTKVFNLNVKSAVYSGLVVTILILPWSEELYIAYNFDRLCRKDAGLFITKTVTVDGFYDDTTHWWRQLKESSQFRFVESRDNTYGGLWRVERDGDDVRHFKIEKPTARYHYKRVDNHRPLAHQIRRHERVIVDTDTDEVIGRYTNYTRGPYWFFIHLDRPTLGCREARGKDILVYPSVLHPAK